LQGHFTGVGCATRAFDFNASYGIEGTAVLGLGNTLDWRCHARFAGVSIVVRVSWIRFRSLFVHAIVTNLLFRAWNSDWFFKYLPGQ
jgi:hypothetical protein